MLASAVRHPHVQHRQGNPTRTAPTSAVTRPAQSASDEATRELHRFLECVAVLEANCRLDAAIDLVTVFHSSAVPPISLAGFCHRIIYHSGYGVEALAIALALVGRYASATNSAPTPLTCHRLMLASIIVGMKAMSDRFVQNAHMAPIVGVPLQELNRLEVALLRAIHFAAMPTAAEVLTVPERLGAMRREASKPDALFAALTAATPTPTRFTGPPRPRFGAATRRCSSSDGSVSPYLPDTPSILSDVTSPTCDEPLLLP